MVFQSPAMIKTFPLRKLVTGLPESLALSKVLGVLIMPHILEGNDDVNIGVLKVPGVCASVDLR